MLTKPAPCLIKISTARSTSKSDRVKQRMQHPAIPRKQSFANPKKTLFTHTVALQGHNEIAPGAKGLAAPTNNQHPHNPRPGPMASSNESTTPDSGAEAIRP
jgi:hypothetical protein